MFQSNIIALETRHKKPPKIEHLTCPDKKKKANERKKRPELKQNLGNIG
jgi:hypothetical protein